MDFPSELVRGRLTARYKRFFADVTLDDGREITAHCPNPGAMLGLNTPGLVCWVSKSDDPKRKLAYTLELVEVDGGLVGINTMHPNRIVAEALAAGLIPELTGYEAIRREVNYGERSRVDFLLTGPDRPDGRLEFKNRSDHLQNERPERRAWIEVKNVHLSRTKGLSEFPDCVSARSAKHLRELQAMVEAGDRAAILFVIQREDCETFSICRDIDPTFAATLDRAADAGVEVLVYQCEITTDTVRLARRVDWQR